MDEACAELQRRYPSVTVWSYVDDLTIACAPEMAKEVANAINNILASQGFRVNLKKSAVTAKSIELIRKIENQPTHSEIEILAPSDPFLMLGAIINFERHREFVEEKKRSLAKFLAKLREIPLHPQLKWTILRLCGAPKFHYIACTMPPLVTTELMKHFDLEMKSSIESILDAEVQPQYIHDEHGAGFPCYARAAESLYRQSQDMALGVSVGEDVQLLLNTLTPSAGILSQQDASFMFYAAINGLARLEGAEFIMAMCIRLRTLPRGMDFPRICKCTRELPMGSVDDFINHALSCKKLSSYPQASRHNRIRDTLAAVVRTYGISVTLEPTFYVYNCREQRRPDIVFHARVAVATDVCVVHPAEAPRVAAVAAAARKVQDHNEAVTRENHKFFPFVLETFGYMHESCHQLIDELKKSIPPHLRQEFDFDVKRSVSCALARARVVTIRGALLETAE
jgi:hypothetical protein